MKKLIAFSGGLAILVGAQAASDGVASQASVWRALFGPHIAAAAGPELAAEECDVASEALVADQPSDIELRVGDGPLAPPTPTDEASTTDLPNELAPGALPLPLPAQDSQRPNCDDASERECSSARSSDDGIFPIRPAPLSRHLTSPRQPASRANDLFNDRDRRACPGGVCEVPRSARKLNEDSAASRNSAGDRIARRRPDDDANGTRLDQARQRAPVRRASQERPVAQPATVDSANGSAGVAVDWLVPREVNLGEAVACQLVVHNRGASDALDVAVEVALPEHVRFEGADPQPVEDGDRLTWQVGRMSGDQTAIILVRLAPQTEGNFTPRAAVTCTQATAAEIRVAQPELSLEVSGPEQASVGQSATYQFHVTNRGDGAAVNVVVHAKLDPSFEHPQGERVEYRLGMLAAGETRSVEVVLSGRDHGEFEILGAVTAGDHILARAEHVVHIARPHLELDLEGPGRRFVDRKANYLVQIHNPGPAVAENVHVTQAVPEGFRFVQATPGGSYDAKLRQVGWFVGRLEADETAEVGLQLIPTEVGQHLLSAEVQADAGVIGSAELETRVDGVSAVVLEIVDMDDPVEVAGRTAYQLRVSNHGSIPARQVQVGAKVPSQLRVTDAIGPTAGDVRDSQVTFDTLDRLEPGETRVFQVFVECLEAGQATFRGFVRSDDQDQPTTVEELTRVYEE